VTAAAAAVVVAWHVNIAAEDFLVMHAWEIEHTGLPAVSVVTADEQTQTESIPWLLGVVALDKPRHKFPT
jgi:hypothetical protein